MQKPSIGGYFKQRVFLQNFIVGQLWPTFSKKYLVNLNFSLKFSLFTNIPYHCFALRFDNLLKTLNYDHCFLGVVSTVDCFVKPLLFNVIILFQPIQQFSFYGFVCFFWFCSLAPLEPIKNIFFSIRLWHQHVLGLLGSARKTQDESRLPCIVTTKNFHIFV